MTTNIDPFEDLIRDADSRNKAILQLKDIQEIHQVSAKKFMRRANLCGLVLGILISSSVFDFLADKLLQVPFKINQTGSVLLGFGVLYFVSSAFYSSSQTKILDTQIKMLQLAEFVDEGRNNKP